MIQPEHKAMNQFLNSALQSSNAEAPHGRVPMSYAHPKSRDSFRPLSQHGWDVLGASFRRHCRGGRDGLKLRTTTNAATGEVEARIVKCKIADLHIFNPAGEYDTRISVNLEANLNLPSLGPDYASLSEDWPPGSSISPDRMKDRMSYAHLVYRVDLTMVSLPRGAGVAVAPKYELELEVQAEVLREQMRRAAREEDHAFADVVSGFLDNATYLMRQRAA